MITKLEACKILNIKLHTLNNFIKSGLIKSYKTKVFSDSVYQYQKELEERRNITPAKWKYINTAT